MKPKIFLGLVVLVLVLSLRRPDTSPQPLPKVEPVSVEPRQIARAVRTADEASPTLRPDQRAQPVHATPPASPAIPGTQEVQPVHATFLAAVEAETDPDLRSEASERVVESVSDAAASWVSQFPDIPMRDAAVQNLLALWTSQDAEAGNWVRELPVGALRDSGITAYGQALADGDSTSAVAPSGGR